MRTNGIKFVEFSSPSWRLQRLTNALTAIYNFNFQLMWSKTSKKTIVAFKKMLGNIEFYPNGYMIKKRRKVCEY